MKRTMKYGLTAAAAAVAVVAGGYGIANSASFEQHGQVPTKAAQVDVKAPQVDVKAAKEVVEKNLSKAQKQKAEELAQLRESYTLPAGATFETENDPAFSELNDQLDKLNAQAQNPSSQDEKVEPEKVWYEPGYFKSDALIQWQCAWLKEAVKATDAKDTAAFNHAYNTLENFKHAPEASMFPDYEDFLTDNLHPLKKGETASAKGFLKSGQTCAPANQLK